MNKPILESIHGTAKDLHDAGLMKDVTLREFDTFYLPPVKTYTAAQIRRIRKKAEPVRRYLLRI